MNTIFYKIEVYGLTKISLSGNDVFGKIVDIVSSGSDVKDIAKYNKNIGKFIEYKQLTSGTIKNIITFLKKDNTKIISWNDIKIDDKFLVILDNKKEYISFLPESNITVKVKINKKVEWKNNSYLVQESGIENGPFCTATLNETVNEGDEIVISLSKISNPLSLVQVGRILLGDNPNIWGKNI